MLSAGWSNIPKVVRKTLFMCLSLSPFLPVWNRLCYESKPCLKAFAPSSASLHSGLSVLSYLKSSCEWIKLSHWSRSPRSSQAQRKHWNCLLVGFGEKQAPESVHFVRFYLFLSLFLPLPPLSPPLLPLPLPLSETGSHYCSPGWPGTH